MINGYEFKIETELRLIVTSIIYQGWDRSS
jgi:hypothetical protein